MLKERVTTSWQAQRFFFGRMLSHISCKSLFRSQRHSLMLTELVDYHFNYRFLSDYFTTPAELLVCHTSVQDRVFVREQFHWARR